MSKSNPLGKYEGRPIVETGIRIRKTGDGLSNAMAAEPRVMHVGDEGYIVLEFKVVDVSHPAEKRHDPAFGGVKRIHILDAGTATFIDGEYVEEAIAQQREVNLRHAAEQRGQHEIGDTALIAAHEEGAHADGLVDHCPLCAEEKALEADGK